MPEDQINLRDFEGPRKDVKVIQAESHANAVSWGFRILLVTIVVGLLAYVALDIARLEAATLREWLQTTIAGEIGLLAGLLGSQRDHSA
jgi:hypothetical protein